MTASGNSPEVDELLREGLENLNGLSDARLREYAVFWLKSTGATSGSTVAELVSMAAVNLARTREQHADVLANNESADLFQLFVDAADDLEHELRVRAFPN